MSYNPICTRFHLDMSSYSLWVIIIKYNELCNISWVNLFLLKLSKQKKYQNIWIPSVIWAFKYKRVCSIFISHTNQLSPCWLWSGTYGKIHKHLIFAIFCAENFNSSLYLLIWLQMTGWQVKRDFYVVLKNEFY